MTSGSPWLAIIALDQLALPAFDRVAAQVRSRLPESLDMVETSQTQRGVTLQWGTITANYTLVDQPVPWDRIEGPCATAWYWPEAEQSMRRHTSHLLLTLLDEGRDPIETAMQMTRLVTALALESDALGIIWGPSGQVHKPEDYAAMASVMQRDDLPLHLWVDFRVTQTEDQDGFALFTTGLHALGHSEFETPHFNGEPQHLAGAVYNIAHYVLEKGPVLKDGEAVGLPDGGQMNVSFAPSLIDEDQEVIQLRFE